MAYKVALERQCKIFGERLRYLREKRGIEAKTLAIAVGYTNGSAITQMEAGDYNPTLEKILRIAEVLEIEPAYLLMEGSPVVDEIAVEAQQCSPEEQQALAAFLVARNKHRRANP